MSLEQAISDHAAAIRELAAAILKAGDRVTTTHAIGPNTVSVTETKSAAGKPEVKADAKPDPKPQGAAKPAGVTGKPGADQKASSAASSMLSYEDVKVKILELSKKSTDGFEGRAKCAALLERFGVTKGPDLKDTQYEEFSTLINKVLTGAYDPRDGDPQDESAVEPEDDGMA